MVHLGPSLSIGRTVDYYVFGRLLVPAAFAGRGDDPRDPPLIEELVQSDLLGPQ